MQKRANLVDLANYFKISLWLQKSALTRLRTDRPFQSVGNQPTDPSDPSPRWGRNRKLGGNAPRSALRGAPSGGGIARKREPRRPGDLGSARTFVGAAGQGWAEPRLLSKKPLFLKMSDLRAKHSVLGSATKPATGLSPALPGREFEVYNSEFGRLVGNADAGGEVFVESQDLRVFLLAYRC